MPPKNPKMAKNYKTPLLYKENQIYKALVGLYGVDTAM